MSGQFGLREGGGGGHKMAGGSWLMTTQLVLLTKYVKSDYIRAGMWLQER